jgi:phosphatidate cytidylyltransferase
MVAYPGKSRIISKMLKRVLAAIVLALIGIPAVIFGGIYYFVLITLLLGIAAWEFGRIFHTAGYHASIPFLVGGVLFVLATRAYFPDFVPAALTISILAAMTWHLIDYEQGRDPAATDFTVTVSGVVYLGWIGSYLFDLRNLEQGVWWFFLVLGIVWLADSFAYFIGVRFGRHRLSPRLSPKKSWEGYWGGVLFGTLGAIGLSVLWASLAGPVVPWWKAAALGAALSILTTLGDLGESMLKRQAGIKDSSNIIPGHGGVFDRIDSWLWGAAIGYFLIIWFLI